MLLKGGPGMKRVFGIILTMAILIMCAAAEAEELSCLTAENCEDLATMLDSEYPYDELMEEFATVYSGQTIAIDGFIYDVKTWGDIQIHAGLYEDATGGGPFFAFKDVQPEDLGFDGTEFPDFIEYGNHVHIVGEVREYDDWDACIVLEPLSIEIWNPFLDGLDTRMYTTLQKGSKGDEVKELQQRLIDLHYLEDQADGSYGNNTKKAVEKFQTAIKMEATGIADPSTQAVLFSDNAPERTLSISSSTMTVGSNSTTVWYVDGQEFTLNGSNTKTVKTIWGTYKFDAYGNHEKVE